jgi:hypothetical protein
MNNMEHLIVTEKALKGSGNLQAFETHKKFREAWKKAGYPVNFRWSRSKGRMWDRESRKEHLEDIKDPSRVEARIKRQELRERRELLR